MDNKCGSKNRATWGWCSKLAAVATMVLVAGLMLPASPAKACSPYCNDPLWQHQQQIMQQQAEELRLNQEAAARAQGVGQVLQTVPVRRLPAYVPPRPPRGWQPAYTGYVSFISGEDEDGTEKFDFKLASNFPTEQAAKAAVRDLCIEGIFYKFASDNTLDRKQRDCEEKSIVLGAAYYSVALTKFGDFTIPENSNRYDWALYDLGMSIKQGSKIWYCSDVSLGLPGCQSVLLGMGANGIFAGEIEQSVFAYRPCASTGPDANQAIVGVDASSGQIKPLCGPNATTELSIQRRGLFESFAIHPRYVEFWSIGGFETADAADAAAIELCNRTTGGGCMTLGNGRNGVGAVFRNNAGKLFLGQGPNEAAARQDGRRQCDIGEKTPCRFISARIMGSDQPRTPKSSGFGMRRTFAAAAVVNRPLEGEEHHIWVASQFPSMREAEEAAVRACANENETKGACSVKARVMGGDMLFVTDRLGKYEIITSQNVRPEGDYSGDGFKPLVADVCTRLGSNCEVNTRLVFDTNEEESRQVEMIRLSGFD